MIQNLKSILAGASLLLAMLSCNMPFDQVPPPDEIQTAAALTLQAILTPSFTSIASTPIITTTSSPRVTRTASPAGSSTTTITPTYSVPILTVRESTNCRTGPGEAYEVVFTYLTGKELEIVGRYDPGNFWLVKSAESPTGTCWLWGEFVDVSGSYGAVPSVTPPPTVTARPPRAPGILEWNFSCSDGTITFSVNWADNAANEAGYRIFRNGEAIAELPADSVTYTDVFNIQPDQSVEYYIQVFGPSGTANSSIMRMRC
ncbi:MAG: SH3 domain-containing protein [Nitrospira sp.]